MGRQCWHLSEGCSYKLSGLIVRTFRNEKYLSVPRDNFTITEIDDIGEVSVPAVGNASNEHVTQAVVKGIKHLDVFRACYSCTGKVAETSEVLGDCTRYSNTSHILMLTVKTLSNAGPHSTTILYIHHACTLYS